MKRSVRFTKDEYSYILRCEEYLKVASFIPQKFDDSDIINMAINYAWKKKKTELDLIFQNSYKSIENLNKAMGFLKTVFDRTGLINEFKEEDKKESKTIFLSNESENIIQKSGRQEIPQTPSLPPQTTAPVQQTNTPAK